MKFKSKLICLLLVFVMLLSVSTVVANENTTQSFKEVSADSTPVNVESKNEEVLSRKNNEEYCNDEAISSNSQINKSKPLKSSPVLDVPDVTKNYGGPEKLEITLTENGTPITNADIIIKLGDLYYGKRTDSKGKAYTNIDLNAGSYEATVTYKTISTTAKIIVNQLSTKTTLEYTTHPIYGVNLTALINPATSEGNVIFTLNGKDYEADKIKNGKATLTLSNLDNGNYEAKATYQGDVNYKSSLSNSVKFTVKNVKIEVTAPDLTKYYHGPENFVVTVKEDNKPAAGKNVTINLNDVSYNRTTDKNGQATLAINLNSGKYNVTSDYIGMKVNSTITVKPTVSGNDITKIYKNGTQYYATFVDTNGNLMKNADVTFNINGVFYTRKTNDQGVAKMNINLNPGSYIITAKNPNSQEQHTNLIKVLPSITEVHNLTKYYRNESKLTFKLLDNEGNPVGAGVNGTININGVFYTKKTNSSGYINLNINLAPGTYIATLNYNGLMASSTVKVLPILSAENIEMKYKDGSEFKAKLLDGQGNPYPNQKITFNINGVFYDRPTDENGTARLIINLIPGEYIITSMYENGAAISNKIRISNWD